MRIRVLLRENVTAETRSTQSKELMDLPRPAGEAATSLALAVLGALCASAVKVKLPFWVAGV